MTGQVRAEVVADDRYSRLGRVQGAQVAAELRKLHALLAGLDVPEQLVVDQVVGGEQAPDAVVAVVSRPASWSWVPVGFFVLSADRGPVPARMWHQLQRPELVQVPDHLWFAVFGEDLAISNRLQVLHPRFPRLVLRVLGRLPGLYPLKRDAFVTE